MSARYFLVSASGDEATYLIDVEDKTVERVDGTAGLDSKFDELRASPDDGFTSGVSLAVAAESTMAFSAFTLREVTL